jgi:hypothetical protein
LAGRREVTIVEAAEERRLVGPNPNDLGAYMSGINAMPRKGLENRLSEAQEALDAIEAKLEELMCFRDAAVVLAAAVSARSPP